MPTVTIRIPPQFMQSVNQLMADIQKFQVSVIQTQQTVQQLNINQTQKIGTQIGSHLTRMNQLFKKIGSSIVQSIDRMLQSMGALGRLFVSSFTVGAEVLEFLAGPIGWAVGTTVAVGSFTIPIAMSFTRWIYDKIVKLGDNLLQDWLVARGTFSTVSGVRAFRASFAGLPIDDDLFTRMAVGRADTGSDEFRALLFFKIKEQQDSTDMLTDLMLATSAFMKNQSGGIDIPVAQAFRLTSIFPPKLLLALIGMDQKELEEKIQHEQELKKLLRISPEAVKGWSKFSVSLNLMWVQIETIIAKKLVDPNSNFVKSLTQLIKAMSKLVEMFLNLPISQKAIDLITNVVQRTATYLEKGSSPTIRKNLKDVAVLMADSGKEVDKLRGAVERLSDTPTALPDKAKAIPSYDARGEPVGTKGPSVGASRDSYVNRGGGGYGVSGGPTFRPGVGPGPRVRDSAPANEAPTRPGPFISNVPRAPAAPGEKLGRPVRPPGVTHEPSIRYRTGPQAPRVHGPPVPVERGPSSRTPGGRGQPSVPVVPPPPRFRAPVSPETAPETIKAAKEGQYAAAGAAKGTGTIGWWTPDRTGHAVDVLTREGGLSEVAAKGLVSRWAFEAPGGPSEVNRSSGAYGIAQWLGPRKPEALATKGDFDAQLRYAIKELKGPERRAYEQMQRATTPQEAAAAASAYERAERPFIGRTMENYNKLFPAGTQPGGGLAPYTTQDIQKALRGAPTPSTAPPPTAQSPPRGTPITGTQSTPAARPPPMPPGIIGGAPGVRGAAGTPSGPAITREPIATPIPVPGQEGRPNLMGGEGELEGYGRFHWGSGGPAAHPSIPYGDYPVTPSTIGAWGTAHGAIGINNNKIWDSKLGRYREGIEIHSGSGETLDRMHTAGCFAISASEWPSFRKALLAEAAKKPLYLHVRPDGAASINHNKEMLPPASQQRTGLIAAKEPPAQPSAAGVQGLPGGPSGPAAGRPAQPPVQTAGVPGAAGTPGGPAAVRGAVAVAAPPQGQQGGVISPFPGQTDFRIGEGNVYGASRSGGGRAHSGNDLHAGPGRTENGTPVVSMTGGTVLYNGRNQGYNANIVIKGDDGIIRRYAVHGSTDKALTPGTRVEQGRYIGAIGENHLHYEEIPPTLNGRPNSVYREFEANAATNTFTSTSHQRGTVDPSGPAGSLQNIGKPAPDTVAKEGQKGTEQSSTTGNRKVMIFLHGMESRYNQGGVSKTPAEVEESMRRYATAKGYDFEAINVSGDYTQQQLKEAEARIKKGGGDVGAVTGFSAGGSVAATLKRLHPELDTTIIGNKKYQTTDFPGEKHMNLPEALAKQAEQTKTAEEAKVPALRVDEDDAHKLPNLGLRMKDNVWKGWRRSANIEGADVPKGREHYGQVTAEGFADPGQSTRERVAWANKGLQSEESFGPLAKQAGFGNIDIGPEPGGEADTTTAGFRLGQFATDQSKEQYGPDISLKSSSQEKIHPNALGFVRAIGRTETDFSRKEAYSDATNRMSYGNRVSEYDYGYYQMADRDVNYAVNKLGMSPDLAQHLNGGPDHQSTVEQQTAAVNDYLKRRWPDAYQNLVDRGDYKGMVDATRSGKSWVWFGLRDKPEAASTEYNKTRETAQAAEDVVKVGGYGGGYIGKDVNVTKPEPFPDNRNNKDAPKPGETKPEVVDAKRKEEKDEKGKKTAKSKKDRDKEEKPKESKTGKSDLPNKRDTPDRKADRVNGGEKEQHVENNDQPIKVKNHSDQDVEVKEHASADVSH